MMTYSVDDDDVLMYMKGMSNIANYKENYTSLSSALELRVTGGC